MKSVLKLRSGLDRLIFMLMPEGYVSKTIKDDQRQLLLRRYNRGMFPPAAPHAKLDKLDSTSFPVSARTTKGASRSWVVNLVLYLNSWASQAGCFWLCAHAAFDCSSYAMQKWRNANHIKRNTFVSAITILKVTSSDWTIDLGMWCTTPPSQYYGKTKTIKNEAGAVCFEAYLHNVRRIIVHYQKFGSCMARSTPRPGNILNSTVPKLSTDSRSPNKPTLDHRLDSVPKISRTFTSKFEQPGQA